MLRIDERGNRFWKNEDGKFHRVDGPACEYIEGTKMWYINGSRHRINGPAIEWSDGDRDWWVNDKRHREDGPAIELNDGTKCWFLNGNKYSEKEHREKVVKYVRNKFK